MKFSLFTLLRLAFVGCAYFLFVSCSKDADLLSDYVVTDTDDISQTYALLVNDTYFSDMNTSVVLDVLSNDNLTNLENVTIVETSTPTFGSVVINEDNTLTYTPPTPVANESETVTVANESETVTVETESETVTVETESETVTVETETATTETETITTEEEVVDTFVYITEETSEEGEVTTAEATVTVTMSNIESKYPTTGPNVFYVSTSGVSTNNGKSEQSAWEISHAFKTAKAGDILHIKAGNYGSKNLIVKNSGTSNKSIQFIGYTNTPGDLISQQGSTFKYGDELDSSKMPLIKSNSAGQSGIGLHVHNDYIEIENFQVQLYERGLDANGESQIFKNIITYQTGPQNVNTPSGQGIVIRGNNTKLENSFDYNSVSQGITLNGATNSTVNYCQVYNDNVINPGGYYLLLSGGTQNSIVDNCVVYRKPGLFHGGHGYVMKDVATNNIIRNSVAHNTGIEANFRDVHDNTWEDIKIYGVYPNSDIGSHSSTLKLANGAHHNTFKNISLKDVKRGFAFEDWDDGFVGNGGDMAEGSHHNTFDGITVDNASRLIYMAEGTTSSTFSDNNTWLNCDFKNIELTFALLTKNNNNLIKDSTFDNLEQWESSKYDFNFSFENCTFKNAKFPTNGISN